MNKKLLNRVLIVMMLTIWGVVFYRLFNFSNNDEHQIDVSQNFVLEKTSLFNFTKDTFNLINAKRDPFLDKMYYDTKKIASPIIKKSAESTVLNLSNKVSKPRNNSGAKWPKINYYGFVKGAKSSSVLVLIKIDNQLHKLRKGDKIEDIVIKKVFRDSVILQKGKQKKSILKS